MDVYICYIIIKSQVEHCLFIIGYSLAFGAVLAKMWRVYQVFHNPTPNKKVSYRLYCYKAEVHTV